MQITTFIGIFNVTFVLSFCSLIQKAVYNKALTIADIQIEGLLMTFLLYSSIQYAFDLRALSSEYNYFIMAKSMIYVGPKYSSINNKEYCLLFQKQNQQQVNTRRHTHKINHQNLVLFVSLWQWATSKILKRNINS